MMNIQRLSHWGAAWLLLLCAACKKEHYTGKDPYADAKAPLNIKIDKTTAAPATGGIGTTVTITGSGFLKYRDSAMVVKFNDVPGDITGVTESTITAKVPEDASSGIISLTVQRQLFAGPVFRVTGPVTIDASFHSVPGASANFVSTISFVPGGKYIIGGDFEDYDNSGARYGYHGLARINADGSLDRDFKIGKGIAGYVSSIAVQASGKYIVGGSIGNYDARFKTGYVRNIVRLHPNGMYDSTVVVTALGNHDTIPGLNAYLDGDINKILQTPDSGKLVLVGNFTYFMRKDYTGITLDGKRDSILVDSIRMEGVMRLNEDGSFDSTFNYDAARRRSYEGANGPIAASIIQADGKILLAGSFTRYHNQLTGGVVRLNPNGEIDPGFNMGAGPDDRVFMLTPLKDGRYLIGGLFSKVNGKEAHRLAVLNADGSLYDGFSVGTGPEAGPYGTPTRAIQLKNGKIFVNGFFDTFSGVKRGGTVILDEDGKMSKGYNSMGAIDNMVLDMLNLPNGNGTIMVGRFLGYDQLPLNRIMLLRY